MYRKDELEVPVNALRECCANALAHMDWRKTESVGVTIYDDRIEIENAGMLPEEIPFHAGYSKLGNRFRVNTFSIGIEFQGNTLERPLTDEQIESAIEYLRPIIKKYNIKAKNIVTHQMVRDAYMKAIPGNKKAYPKVDITPVEYERVMNALDTAGLLRKK
ncbi:MAG: N-acetylmuramoyl-L-alanine amidase [Muribaculaceae bacterium]|nr:N-acetylmuramoyl-L-alanine amidase [Muribaculaceae bacterium]